METAVRFPTEAEKLARAADGYRQASPDDRLRALLDLSALCADFLASSPNGDRQRRLLEEREESEHERWRYFIRSRAGAPRPIR